jgi:hypothetical protein
MGLTASLREPDLRVAPGQEVSAQVNLLNTGSVVDQVTVDVVGQAAAWSTVEPAVLNLYPGESGIARVTFHPPRSPEAPAGVVPFGVRAASREDPAGSIVEEGAIEVAAFTDFAARLHPISSRGRRRGRHRLTVVNGGNISAGAAIHFVDPEDQLAFRVSKPTLVAQPGVANVLRVQVIPRKRFMRGPNQHHPFQVMVAPDEGDSSIVDGELVQQPLLAPWVVPVVAALVALVILGTVLWFTLLKPSIKSAATEAVNAQATPISAAVDKANQQAEQAKTAASQAASAAAAAGANPSAGTGTGGTGTGTGTGTPGLNTPFDFRIQADTPANTGTTFTPFTFPGQNAKPIDITDIQLQNPAGDSGTVEIRRNGAVWLRFGLDNFRDYDDHFVVPVHFKQGETVTFAVQCRNLAGKRCSPALTFSGRTTG